LITYGTANPSVKTKAGEALGIVSLVLGSFDLQGLILVGGGDCKFHAQPVHASCERVGSGDVTRKGPGDEPNSWVNY